MATNSRASGVVAIVAIVAALTACAPNAPSVEPPDVLVAALDEGAHDGLADERCEGTYQDQEFLATLDSTSADVREIARRGPNGQEPDVQTLPVDPGEYVAICIGDVEPGSGFDGDYIAYWLSQSGAGIVAVW